MTAKSAAGIVLSINKQLHIMKHAVRIVSMNIKMILLLSILWAYLPILAQGNHAGQQRSIENITIDLNVKNVSLSEVFRQITKSTKIRFSYRNADLEHVPPVSIRVAKEKLQQVLNTLTINRGLEWEYLNDVVVIRKSEKLPQNDQNVTSLDTTVNITGVVRDSENRPIPGVSISVKGAGIGATTNNQGEFHFTNVPKRTTLVFSSIGFLSQERKIGNEANLSIVMQMDIKEIEAVSVVSTGYQEIPKERATGSFYKIGNDMINRSVSTNILDRIKEITSGLNFEPRQKGGRDITIRGNSTINANPRPLIVVDGFPYDESANLQNIINAINPNDVESITVLKDAAAASIWGARSGNGVIVITTKRGRFNQKVKVQLNSNVTIGERPNLLSMPVISSKDLVEFERTRFATGYFDAYDGLYADFGLFPPLSPVVEILLAQKKGAITSDQATAQLTFFESHDVRDDVNKHLLQNSVNQQYNVNISGGTANYSYYGSVGYDKNKDNNIGNHLNRFTLRFDNTYRPIPKLSINTFLVLTQANTINNAEPYAAFSPYYSLIQPDGIHASIPSGQRLAYVDTASIPGLLDWHYRPLDELNYNDNKSEQTDNRFGGELKYTIINGISFDLKFQYQKSTNGFRNINTLESYEARNLINQFLNVNNNTLVYPVPLGGYIDRFNSEVKSWNVRGQFNFNKEFNDITVTAIAGMETREISSSFYSSRQYGYDPETGTIINNVDFVNNFSTRPATGSQKVPNPASLGSTLYRYLSYFSNGAISYKDKYTISGSARFDGSNFFGVKANQRIVPLWSTGASWNISRESFYGINWLPYLRFRATYGFNGNTNNSATSFSTIKYFSPGSSYIPEQYAAVQSPPNPQLRWEKVGMMNIGLDFQSKNQRITGSVEYYTKNSTDLIGPVLIDPTTGFASFTGNQSNMKGKGIDVTLNTSNIKGPINWNTTLLFNYNQEKVTAYQYINTLVAASYISGGIVVGKPLLPVYSYQWGGLDPKTWDPRGMVADTIAPYNVVLTGTNTNPENLVYHGSQTPQIYGSLLNSFSVRGITLSFNIIYKFNYYFRRESIQYGTLFREHNPTAHSDYAQRWKKPGDELTTYIPSLPTAANSARDIFYSQSEILIEKADHIRFQDIRLGYNLTKDIIKGLPFQNIQLFGYVNNLGIIWRANKHNIDPDYPGMKPSKTFAFGLNVDF